MKNKFGIHKVLMLMVCIALFFALKDKMTVSASDTELEANILLTISSETDVKEKPDKDSQTLGTLSEGTPAISLEAPDNGWIKVKYQDLEGYVLVTSLNAVTADDEMRQEFDEIENEYRLNFEKLEYEKSLNRQKLVWGIVIGGLVIVMFILGIITGLDNKKRKDRHEANNSDTLL
jgi:hypothetical protein